MLVQRQRRGLRIKWKFLVFFSVAALVFLGAAYLVLYSSFFKVNKLEVQGPGFYDKNFLVSNIIVQILRNNKFLGFLGSDNVIFWFFGGRGELMNNTLSIAEDVQVTAALLTGEVEISLKERELFGVLCRRNECYAFDEDGVIFGKAPNVYGPLILKINDSVSHPVILGSYILSNVGWVNNIFETSNILGEKNVYTASIILRQKDLREWEALLPSGAKFYFSLEFVPEDFSAVLENIKKKVDLEDLSYLDFRVRGRIYYK